MRLRLTSGKNLCNKFTHIYTHIMCFGWFSHGILLIFRIHDLSTRLSRIDLQWYAMKCRLMLVFKISQFSTAKVLLKACSQDRNKCCFLFSDYAFRIVYAQRKHDCTWVMANVICIADLYINHFIRFETEAFSKLPWTEQFSLIYKLNIKTVHCKLK